MFAILLLPVIEHGTGAAPNEHVCRGDFTVFPRADMRVCAPVLLTQSGNANPWQVGAVMMGLQKDEARDAPVKPAKLDQLLQDMYGMEVIRPSPIELDAFRRRTRSVYDKWASDIGMDLVGTAERLVDREK